MLTDELLKMREGTQERCGLILTGNRIIELKNQSQVPEEAFAIDAEDLIKHHKEMIGTWHTHVVTTSYPSGADYVCFQNWPLLKHYIVGTDGVKCYKLDGKRVVEDK